MLSFNTANGSSCLMKEILRDEWRFADVVISDGSAIAQYISHCYTETGMFSLYTEYADNPLLEKQFRLVK